MKRLLLPLTVSAAILCIGSAATAAETITYTYDAKGRLVKVDRSGTVNDGEKVEYQHDKADNRTRVTSTG